MSERFSSRDIIADIDSDLLGPILRGDSFSSSRQIEFVDDARVQLQLFVEQARATANQVRVVIIRADYGGLGTRLWNRTLDLNLFLGAKEAH